MLILQEQSLCCRSFPAGTIENLERSCFLDYYIKKQRVKFIRLQREQHKRGSYNLKGFTGILLKPSNIFAYIARILGNKPCK